MSQARRIQYLASGLLAVAPTAVGGLFLVPANPETTPRRFGALAVVDVVGPLVHHEGGEFCSYDGLKRRVGECLESNAQVVLVSCDTVGGDFGGMLDTSRELVAMCADAGKPLHWYVDAQSLSAGAGLACAAERIYCPESGQFGSIGVLLARKDETKLDAMMGVGWHIIASGVHKADANSHLAASDEALAEIQRHVDATAAMFFGLVSERRGISVDSLVALQGRTLHGREALSVGLVDEIATFDEVVAKLTSGLEQHAQAGKGVAMDRKAMIAALAALAEKGDEQAKKALAAFDAPEGEEKKDEEKKGEDTDKSKAKAEGDAGSEEKKDEEKKDEDTEKAKASGGIDLEARAGVSAVQGRLDRQEVVNLLSARSDLPEGMRESLSGLAPSVVRNILAKTPVYPKPAGAVAASRAALGAVASQTDSEVGQSAIKPDPAFADLDEKYGLIAKARPLVEFSVGRMYLNPGTPEMGAAHLKQMEANTVGENAK